MRPKVINLMLSNYRGPQMNSVAQTKSDTCVDYKFLFSKTMNQTTSTQTFQWCPMPNLLLQENGDDLSQYTLHIQLKKMFHL